MIIIEGKKEDVAKQLKQRFEYDGPFIDRILSVDPTNYKYVEYIAKKLEKIIPELSGEKGGLNVRQAESLQDLFGIIIPWFHVNVNRITEDDIWKAETAFREDMNNEYVVPNIKNTFVKTTLEYSIDFDQNYSKLISIERPFYSTFTKWAGGFSLSQVYEREITFIPSQVIEIQRYKADYRDYWAGHSVRLFKGNSEYQRSTNFFTTTRFYNKNFVENPVITNDILGVYANEKLYLASLGIASRKYIQDKYIFNFNIVEDIASGFSYSVTGGFQNKNNVNRTYFGGKAALGNLFKFGYLGTNFEYGTYINNGIIEESAAVFKAIYFTNLEEIGTWKFRQFINPEVVIGINRPNVVSDRITLNGESGINGFNSQSLFGTKKLLINFQTQGYSPWKITGFRLNPYFRYTMGLIGDDNRSLFSSKVYSQIGLGVIISNDYLVFKSFQFSFSYYPNLPLDGGSIYKTNAINTSDFGLENFGILKPELVKYQ